MPNILLNGVDGIQCVIFDILDVLWLAVRMNTMLMNNAWKQMLHLQ